MEPSKKYQPNIEPDIRPNLRAIQGGGESTPERGNLETARDLSSSENSVGKTPFGVVDGGGESTPERANLAAVNNAESQGLWRGTGEGNKRDTRNWRQKVAAKVTGRKAATGGLIGLLIGGTAGIGLFSAPAMLLVQVKEVLTNYGASSSRVANSQFENNLFYRLNGDTASACVKPGAISTIRCKRGTMNEKTYKKLVGSGFDVESKKVGGRYVITSLSKDGVTLNGKSSRANIKNAMRHPDFGSSMRKSSNWGTDVFNGSRFSSVVLKKLGLDKRKVELTGANDEERRESANTLTGAADEDTDEKVKEKFESKHGSKITGVAKITNGPAAVAGTVCAGYNMSRATVTAVKLYNAARYASFAMLFLKAADQIKANGEVDPATVALLGGILTSYATTGPTKGLTATDSQGYKVAAYGGEGKLKSFSQKFLLGGNEKLVDIDNSIKAIEDKAPGGKSTLKASCGVATDPIAGTAVTAAMCGATGGTSGFLAGTVVPVIGNAIGGAAGTIAGVGVCVVIGVGVGLAAGAAIGKIFNYILPKIVAALTDAPIDVNKIKGVEAGDALAAGTGVILENTNMSRGLQPGTKESVVAFDSQTSEDQLVTEAIARHDAKATPFDVYNEHSFMGSFIRKSGLINLSSGSLLGTTSALFGTVLSPLRLSTEAAAVGTAISVTKKDLDHCPDKTLRDIGVDCDAVGGTQYTMATDISEEDNLNFMIGTHVEETGNPISDDYKDWVANCTDNRIDPIGSTSVGIEDEDAWKTGEACVAGSDKEINQSTRDQFSTYYYRNAAIDDEEEVKQPVPPNEGGGAMINMASFNVRGASHDGDNGTINYAVRMRQTVKTIQTENFDIIGFQEFETKQRTEFKKSAIANTYKLSSYDSGTDNGNAIAWNKTKYELLRQGTQPGLVYTVGNRLKAPWVKLRDKITGQEFYFLNTHDPANVHDNPPSKNAARRTANARAHLSFMKEKAAEGLPVFATGDYNSTFERRDGDVNVSSSNIRSTLPYCIMTADGTVQNAFDAFRKRDVKCPNNNIDWNKIDPGKGCSTQIDHLYYAAADTPITISEYGCVRKGDRSDNVAKGNGSDHDTVKFAVTINGGGVTDGSMAWPVDQKYYKANKGDFLGAHFANSGTWTNGVDSLAADVGTPPDGSNVYAMLGGTVSKSDLGGHGLAISSKVPGGVVEIAYAHGPRTNSNKTYNAGDKIMEIGCLGNCSGGHLHLDMSFTPDGGSKKGICPQDIFLALSSGSAIDWNALSAKAKAPCGR